MNITNLEIAQASVEIFAGLVCLMGTLIILFNKNKNKSLRYFCYLFILGFFSLTSDACAYIFRGNVDSLSIFMTRSSNFMVFACNIAMGSVFIRYLYGIITGAGEKVNKAFIYAMDATVILGLLLLFINLMTGSMYYFDSNNYYHRGDMYYIFMGITLALPILVIVICILYRKVFTKGMLVANLVYILIPYLALLIQIFTYGFSVVNLGIFIALVLMLFFYLKDWITKENKIDSTRRRSLQSIILFIVMVISMSFSIVSCIISINIMSENSSKKDSITISELVSTTIEKELLKPIMVSKTMASDHGLQELLKSSETLGKEAISADVSTYLKGISKDLDYQQAFIAYDKTKAYYVADGYQKTLDINSDLHDIWYFNFINSDADYELNLDTDQANDDKLSIFVNKKIHDDTGTLIGALGVAVHLEYLISELEEYEETYNIKIDLIKPNGEIQIDSDISKIEVDYLDNSYLSSVTTEFKYEHNNSTARLTKYLPDLDWYIVIVDNCASKINVFEIVIPSVVIFIGGLIIMALIFGLNNIHERKAINELNEKKLLTITDEMTGLSNRRAFEEALKTIRLNKDKYILMIIDINGLKKINDTIGHSAGDELIVGMAHSMQNTFGNYGKCYRVGGDEFIIVSEAEEDVFNHKLETLIHVTEGYKGRFIDTISFSYGHVICKNYDKTVDELLDMADEIMYKYKLEYYEANNIKKGE